MEIVRLQEAILSICKARNHQQKMLADQVKRSGSQLRYCYDDLGQTVRQELKQEVARHSYLGWPPSFLDIAGLGRNERRLNWVIGWWANPQESHGFSVEFLKALALKLRFSPLLNDLHHPKIHSAMGDQFLEVYREQTIPGITSSKKPDLLVSSPNAVLLLENKIEGGRESGDQYEPYLRLLEECARRQLPNLSRATNLPRATKAILCCPSEDQDTPAGWDRRILHEELGSIFEELAQLESAPIWSRISAALTAVAFKRLTSGAETWSRASNVLRQSVDQPFAPSQISEMRTFMSNLRALPEAPHPWQREIS